MVLHKPWHANRLLCYISGTQGIVIEISLFYTNYKRHLNILENAKEIKLTIKIVKIIVKDLKKIYAFIKEDLEKIAEKIMKKVNRKRLKGLILKEGEIIYLLRKNIKIKRLSIKLNDIKLRSFKIKRKKGLVIFELDLLKIIDKVYSTFHISLLKSYKNPNTMPRLVKIDEETGEPRWKIERIVDFDPKLQHYLIKWLN